MPLSLRSQPRVLVVSLAAAVFAACSFPDHEFIPADEFEKLNTKVIGCSVDSHFSHLAWSNTPRKEGGLGEIRYPILSDIKKEVAWNYGVLLDGGVAARGLFVIDDKGILQAYMVNNLSVGRSVDEALRLIQGYQ